MLLAINTVMFLFRRSNNKNSRMNYIFTEYLKEANDMKDKALAEITELETASQQLSDMLQSLVDWASNHGNEVNLKNENIEKVFNDAISMCEELAKHKNITIEKDIKPMSFIFEKTWCHLRNYFCRRRRHHF